MRSRALAVGTALFILAACVGDDPVQRGALGSACQSDSVCGSGVCADGVCCDRACTGQCEACSADGKCAPVTGKPKHTPCTGDENGACAGTCDGVKVDACSYPTVTCTPASCTVNVATVAATCNAGTCPAPTTQTCTIGCAGETCLGVTQLATGGAFACALMTDKTVRCWGDNGDGVVSQAPADPIAVYRRPKAIPGLTGVKSIAANGFAVIAVLDNGTVVHWGANLNGEMGTGSTDLVPHETRTPIAALVGATSVHGGTGVLCAIVAGGQIMCWGRSDNGRIGDGTTAPAIKPPSVVCAPGSTTLPCAPATNAVHVASGDNHTCAAFADGQVACWGGNDDGQLGRPGGANQFDAFPKYVADVGGATVVTGGNRISCAAAPAAAKCWGTNGVSGLGDGSNPAAVLRSPTPVSVCTVQDCTMRLMNVTGIATYDESTCALSGGAVKCWGRNNFGQLGDNQMNQQQNVAGTTAIASGAVQIMGGAASNYAVVVDGPNRDVRCWGEDSNGQCGDDPPVGTTTYRLTPVGPKW